MNAANAAVEIVEQILLLTPQTRVLSKKPAAKGFAFCLIK